MKLQTIYADYMSLLKAERVNHIGLYIALERRTEQ